MKSIFAYCLLLVSIIAKGQSSEIIIDSCSNIYYNGSQNLRFICCFKNGKLNGEYKSYYLDGKLEKQGIYNLDKKEGKWVYYYENGNKYKEGCFFEDKKNGQWVYWYEDYKVLSTGKYSNDQKDSIWFEYYSNGNIRSFGTFYISKEPGFDKLSSDNCLSYKIYSVKIGEWKEYHSNGLISSVGQYLPKVNCKIQKELEYNKSLDAEITKDVLLIEYIKDGKWIYYDENTNIVKSEFYKKGKLKRIIIP